MDRATIQERINQIMRFKSLYKLEELLAAAYAAGFSDCAMELAAKKPREAAKVLWHVRKEVEDDD